MKLIDSLNSYNIALAKKHAEAKSGDEPSMWPVTTEGNPVSRSMKNFISEMKFRLNHVEVNEGYRESLERMERYADFREQEELRIAALKTSKKNKKK